MLGFSSNDNEKEIEELRSALQLTKEERDKALVELSAFSSTSGNKGVGDFIFRTLIEASTEATLVTDIEGNIIYVNLAWEKLTGFAFADVKGKNPRLLRSPRTPNVVIKKMWDALSAREPFVTEEIINRKKDGLEYETHFSIFPIQFEGKVLYYGSIHADIAERKESDRVRGEFVSLVSHQLNTPLSIINWYSQMLLSSRIGELNHKQAQYVEEIEQSVKRVISLVNALLNVSRIEMGTFSIVPEAISLAGVAEGVLSELKAKIEEKNIKLLKQYENAPASINADSKIAWMIFQNLLSNAIKYTPEGGDVNLEIGVNNENVFIKVRDTGYGIPKIEQSKIFEKMYRAENVRIKDIEGNGLGLYIVKSTLEAAGGTISFKSPAGVRIRSDGTKEECGTEFYVTIPVSGMKPRSGTKVLATTAEI
ncbi:MAG: PAS domain-containing sensor histidine kinase [bacterium]|nr:PAS domain-containing sensor histidine kinase [bacterium]